MPTARSFMGLILAIFFSACSAKTVAPVSEHSSGIRSPTSEYRTVLPGDTLYSIAWESGRDYQELAEWNAIAPPYTIKPGQKLRLFAPKGAGKSRAGPLKPQLSLAPRITATASAKLPASKKPVAEKTPLRPGRPVAAQTSPAFKNLSWVWPAEGNVLDRYDTNGPNKGIDIGGKKAQPVVAAAAGHVVYQGSGLRGYGQLIIIKHDSDFLSAYAHCDKIYVTEGAVVKPRQKIAEMGSSGTDRVKLHFEIRYRGVPVDPLNYLPRK